MTEVFIWQEHGRVNAYAVDTTVQLVSLIGRIVGVLRACDELDLSDELEAFLGTDASKYSPSMCIQQIKRVAHLVDCELESFQIFMFVKLVE